MSKTRMGKRVASLLLSLVMMLSLLPTTVYAEGADTGDTGYLRFDVFSHKTLFSGGNENYACVLCKKHTSLR